MEQNCINCKFYEKHGKLNTGYCQRYPPTVVEAINDPGDRSTTYSMFPTVQEDDWCGEYKEAKINLRVYTEDDDKVKDGTS